MAATSTPSDISDPKQGTPQRRTPWLKAVLIPFWTLQLPLQIFLLIITIYNAVYSVGLETIGSVFLVLIWFGNTFLILTEITLFVTRRLRPLAYLLMQVAKAVLSLALVIFAAVLVGRVYHIDPTNTSTGTTKLIWSLVLICLLDILYIGTLTYASVIYHRHRKAQKLAHTVDSESRLYQQHAPSPHADTRGLHEAAGQPVVYEKGHHRSSTFHESDSTAVASPCTIPSEVTESRLEAPDNPSSYPELHGQVKDGPKPHVAELYEGQELPELSSGRDANDQPRRKEGAFF